MGQDRGSWFPRQRLSSSFAPSHSGHHNTNLVSENFAANMVTVCESSPVYTQVPFTHVGEVDKNNGLVYGLSNLRSPLTPTQKPCSRQISSAVLFRDRIEASMPKVGDERALKRFLVFDQSGDQTTLIFSSGVGQPFEGLTTGSLKHPVTHDMKRDLLRTNEDLVVHQGMVTREQVDENSENHVQSEMHEDTEELNALLYSDDESDYSDEDDEVTSSGHSPSTISAHANEDASVGSTDGISAFAGDSHARKRKLLEYCDYEIHTTSLNASNPPKRSKVCSEDDNSVESSCASCGNAGSIERFLPPNNNKIRNEKISETLSLLRSIVPGGDVEDPIFVFDRAIDYLKSLKTKAKTTSLESLCSLES